MIRPPSARERVIYADYQASTPVDDAVRELILQYFSHNFANPHAEDHAAGWSAAAIGEDAARRIAAVLGCESDEVIFTSGATEANNLAILGAAARAGHGRKRILVGQAEHKSVLEAAHRAAMRNDLYVELLPINRDGHVVVDELKARLRDDVLLVSVMMVNNELGSIEDVSLISSLCDAVGALFHTDAVHGLASGPIRVDDIGCHMLSLSGHKIYGPKGIGLLYMRQDIQSAIEPLIIGGGQQRGLRAGTLPIPLCMGLALSAEMMVRPESEIERDRVKRLRDHFAQEMLALDTVALNGPPLDKRHPGNCNFRFHGHDAKDVLAKLQPRVAASTGSACTSGSIEPSHVLMACGLSKEEANSSIRFSFGRRTTREDIDILVSLIKNLLNDQV